MADRIEKLSSVTYSSARIEPVRGYTAAERKAKIEAVEKDSEDRAEIRKYLAMYPNPEKLSFSDLLDRQLGIGNSQTEDDDEDGFVIDIKNR